jgi:hypothetical protein
MYRAVTGASFAVFLLRFMEFKVLNRKLTFPSAVNQPNTTQVSKINPATFDSNIEV